MAASVLVGRILIIEPIGTVPARLYVAKGLVLTIWTRKFYGTRNYSMELFPEIASSVSFSFSTNYFSTPRGYVKTKKSFTLYRNFTARNRPEQAPINDRGGRFHMMPNSRLNVPVNARIENGRFGFFARQNR